MGSRLSRYAPPLLLMALIFFLSDQPNLKTDLGLVDVILRKLAHMLEYAALWFLWWRAFGYRRAAVAVLIALSYAATDEFHQTFVDGRVGTPVDVAIDAVGVALALIAARAARGRYSQPRSVA